MITFDATVSSNQSYAMAGFTLVEALVAMAIFTIGFSGLYFFYGYSQQAMEDVEKRMYLNLLGDRIIQTIAAEGQWATADTLYTGSLADSSYCGKSVTHTEWCSYLNKYIGSSNGIDPKSRYVDVKKDGTSLVVDVTLKTPDGKVGAYISRKLRQI